MRRSILGCLVLVLSIGSGAAHAGPPGTDSDPPYFWAGVASGAGVGAGDPFVASPEYLAKTASEGCPFPGNPDLLVTSMLNASQTGSPFAARSGTAKTTTKFTPSAGCGTWSWDLQASAQKDLGYDGQTAEDPDTSVTAEQAFANDTDGTIRSHHHGYAHWNWCPTGGCTLSNPGLSSSDTVDLDCEIVWPLVAGVCHEQVP